MDERSPGFCKISEAYEKIVATLEPSARPGDDYLLHQFDEVQKGTDVDKATVEDLNAELEKNLNKALEAEKRAERLFADALKNGQLVRWVWARESGKMTPREVREIWEPDPVCPGLDSNLPDFTIPSYLDGSLVFIEERGLNEWIASQLAARNGNAPTSLEPTALEIGRGDSGGRQVH
jgi:hypothetical protein